MAKNHHMIYIKNLVTAIREEKNITNELKEEKHCVSCTE